MASKITMLTCYDANMARMLEQVGIDYLLVGDSVGMTVYGHVNTRGVSMEDMIRHTQAVRNGAPHAKIITDLPFHSDRTPELALKNAKKLLASGADYIKLEGPKFEVLRYLITHNIRVFGHLGLLPQTAEKFCMCGKEQNEANQIFEDAKKLDKIGVSGIILECVRPSLTKKITKATNTPTIGIGSGEWCDGQVLVINDILGLGERAPKFAKPYINLNSLIVQAAGEFKKEVLLRSVNR